MNMILGVPGTLDGGSPVIVMGDSSEVTIATVDQRLEQPEISARAVVTGPFISDAQAFQVCMRGKRGWEWLDLATGVARPAGIPFEARALAVGPDESLYWTTRRQGKNWVVRTWRRESEGLIWTPFPPHRVVVDGSGNIGGTR